MREMDRVLKVVIADEHDRRALLGHAAEQQKTQALRDLASRRGGSRYTGPVDADGHPRDGCRGRMTWRRSGDW